MKWLRNNGHKAETFGKVFCENILVVKTVAKKGKFKAFGSDSSFKFSPSSAHTVALGRKRNLTKYFAGKARKGSLDSLLKPQP